MAVAVKKSTKEKALDMEKLLVSATEFVALDIETTTLSPLKGGRIIEIGAVKVRNGEIVDRFQQLVHPEQKVYAKTIELTGITNEMLEGQPVFGQVLPQFYKFIGNAVVVAHNANFDWDRFLLHFFKRVGIQPTNQVIDTLALAKLYCEKRRTYGLGELCREFNIDLENHHRAFADAEATAKLALYFKEHFTQGSLFDVQEQVEEPALVLQMEPFRIMSARYWERQVSARSKIQRIYVNLTCGTVYFDINSQSWYNKNVESYVDFELVQEKVLEYLKLNNLTDLSFYRNAR